MKSLKLKAFLKYKEYRKYIFKTFINKYIKKCLIYFAVFIIVVLCVFMGVGSLLKANNISQYCFDLKNKQISKINKLLSNELDYLVRIGLVRAQNNQPVKQEVEEKVSKKEYEEILKKAKELETQNNKLSEDNINLQNWLKKAASRGTKPGNYKEAPQISSLSGTINGEYLGEFTVTAYTPTVEECGNNRGITCSGYPIVPGVTVAVDRNYWPLGTIFYIKGLGYVIAMDSGGAIKGRNRIDFAVFDKDFARKIGRNSFEVYLIKMGNGKVDTKI